MYVRDYMASNVITIPSTTLMVDAMEIMKKNDIRRLPVADHGKLVGLVTLSGLKEASPSAATSLSIYEMHYLLARVQVKEIMVKNVVTVSPEATIEEAALLATRHKIGAMPVVEDGGKVVGIITATDMFNILLEVLGVGEGGVRLHLLESYKGKPLGEVTDVINKHRVRIISLFSVTQPQTRRRDLVLRLDTQNPDELIEDFRGRGYTVEISR